MMSLLEAIQAYLGWCPAVGQVHRQMQAGSGMRGDAPHGGRRRIGGMSMKIDTIVKEEFWRSIGAVYWVSFLTIGYLILSGYLPISISYAFSLAVIPTVAHFLIMVWYRRKENLVDPNPASILRHALGLGRQREKRTEQRRVIIEKAVDATLLVIVFLIYLYASLAYSISQVYWLPVLIIISLFLARIVFIDGGEQRVTVTRLVVFYLITAGFLCLRYAVLGYPVTPLLQAVVLIGIVSFPILYIWERRRTPEGTG